MFGGYQKIYTFENGYGESVVSNSFSYGGKEGLFELAVLKGLQLCYSTPITNDVIGHLSSKDVEDLLKQIEALPQAE